MALNYLSPIRNPIGLPRNAETRVLFVCVFLGLLGAFTGCRTFTRAGSADPLVSARQLSLRGADALERSRYQDAELLFSQALQMSSMDERAHWGYATTLWNRGDQKRAIEHMNQALRLSGRNPEYAIRLGQMYLDTGDSKQARQLALDVLSANRNHAEAWALLGDTHRADREWTTALECYHNALLQKNDYPAVQLSVAELYRITGRPRRALASLDRMTDLHSSASSDANQLLIRGLVFADLNRPAEAADALAKCSDSLPLNDLEHQLQLVQAQKRIGEIVAARINIGRLIAQNPNNPEVNRVKENIDQSFVAMNEHFNFKNNGASPSSARDEATQVTEPNRLPGAIIATPIYPQSPPPLRR